ncbi:MAG TPA: hypothetical protein VF530_20305 [Planctomycetota bacterium]
MSAGEPQRPEDAEPERAEREPAEKDLEDLLARLDPPRPAPAARAEARRAFLTGREASRPAPAPRTPEVMSDARGPETWSEGEPEAFAAWLAALAAPSTPGPAARQRARLAFLSAVASATPAPPRSRTFRAGVWLAAAAAIVLVTLFLPAPDRWRVRLDGVVVLEGEDFGPGHEDRLGVELEHSGWLETRAGRTRLVLGEVLELELLPGTSLHVPPLVELDGMAPLDFELARGEAFVRTRGAYPGNPIRIRTGLAEVLLTGTTVGVLADEAGTCVCVADGRATVTSGRGIEELAAQGSLRLFHDASMMPKLEPFPPADAPGAAHVAELLAFHGGS